MTTTKKKTGLLIVAVALVAVLAVAGTLMLFTAQSKTATNVVTLGGVTIQLHEWVNDGNSDIDLNISQDQDVDLRTAAPGATVTKKPYIVNDGSAPVYAYIGVELIAKDQWGTQIPLTVESLKNNQFLQYGTDAESKATAFLSDIALTAFQGTNDNWQGVTPVLGETIKGGFYYTEAVNPNALKVLGVNQSTNVAFDGIKLPTSIPNSFQGAKFELKVTGYAVQSDNNTAISSSYKNAFDGLAGVL
jgi:hypothetical protein